MIKIICVIDNEAKSEKNLKKEHGLSLWIETGDGVVLFDTGQTAEALSHNLRVLGLSVFHVAALALSHAHYDHTGGLEVIFSANRHIPLYAHPDLFRPRYSLRKGEYKSIGLAYSQAELARHLDLKLSDLPVEIIPGLWTTGEIKERPELTGGSNNLLIQTAEGRRPDLYKDDLSLVLKTGAGLVLICGCCHAGILNTIFHVEKVFGESPAAIVGGTHLVSADDPYLEHVIDTLQKRLPECRYFLNHCTGNSAFQKLSQATEGRALPCPAGTILPFQE